jgi:hypothetical protein
MEKAVRTGARILAVATHGPTVENTKALLLETAEHAARKVSVECAAVERANGRHASRSGAGAPQLTIIGQLAELISKERKPASAPMLSEGAGAGPMSQINVVGPQASRT